MSTNLTYAGNGRQEPGDREAPLKFHWEDVKIGKKRYESRVYTYERDEYQQTWTQIPSERTYDRQQWNIGLAINHHSTTHSSILEALGKKATHWGVYICPTDKQNEETTYRIFGLNFRDATRKQFILGQKWRTSSGGYDIKINGRDFTTKEEHNFPVFCSFEEFQLTVQMLLREFQIKHAGTAEYSKEGNAYNLVFQNCQDFALKVLRYMKDQRWMSPERLQHKFNLADLEAYIKSEEEYRFLPQVAW